MEPQNPLSHTFMVLAKVFCFPSDGLQYLIFFGHNCFKIPKWSQHIWELFPKEPSLPLYFWKMSYLNKTFFANIAHKHIYQSLFTKQKLAVRHKIQWHLSCQCCHLLPCDGRPCCRCRDVLWLQCSPPFVWAEFQRPDSLCADRKELGSQSTVLCSG